MLAPGSVCTRRRCFRWDELEFVPAVLLIENHLPLGFFSLSLSFLLSCSLWSFAFSSSLKLSWELYCILEWQSCLTFGVGCLCTSVQTCMCMHRDGTGFSWFRVLQEIDPDQEKEWWMYFPLVCCWVSCRSKRGLQSPSSNMSQASHLLMGKGLIQRPSGKGVAKLKILKLPAEVISGK